MKRTTAVMALLGVAILTSCGKKEETAEAPTPAVEAPAAVEPVTGPRATVTLKDGSKVPGVIVASSQKDMVVAGDDGIERKIPLGQVKSVEYGAAGKAEEPTRRASREPAPARKVVPEPSRPAPQESRQPPVEKPAEQAAAPPPPPAPVAKTYEVPAGSEVSVRVNEAIDSKTAAEGQTFDAQVTRDVRDAGGEVVIPRGANANVVIRSASQGGRIRGASDLVLDLQSVSIRGRSYTIDSADVKQEGKSGVGANKRTATYTGGGAAIGAIIGAIAGGGKGAAIGAGAGAGAGALTQVLTKGRSIKVPAESVLTFALDKPLHVTAER